MRSKRTIRTREGEPWGELVFYTTSIDAHAAETSREATEAALSKALAAFELELHCKDKQQ